jgi:hypothetical protein
VVLYWPGCQCSDDAAGERVVGIVLHAAGVSMDSIATVPGKQSRAGESGQLAKDARQLWVLRRWQAAEQQSSLLCRG